MNFLLRKLNYVIENNFYQRSNFVKTKTPRICDRIRRETPWAVVYAPVIQKSMEHSTQMEAEV